MDYSVPTLSDALRNFDPGRTDRRTAARRLLGSAPAMDDKSSRTKVDGCMPPTIVARDVYKSFGNGRTATPVLRGVSLQEFPLRLAAVGTLASVAARESQRVSRGAVLAELQNRSQTHQVAPSAAEVAIARAQLQRLRNGERPEKRKAMAAVEEAKRALFQQAKATCRRT